MNIQGNISEKKLKKIDVDEQKKIMLDILKDAAKFCDDNNIRYYLAYGTLLGAVRHKGYIPWDDDIDICMPRPDYKRFIELYDKKGNKNYKICSIYNTPNYNRVCSRLYDPKTIKIERGINYKKNYMRGVEIDIFPLDGLPDDIAKANKHLNGQQRLLKLNFLITGVYSVKGSNIIKTIVKSLLRFSGILYCLPKSNRIAVKIEKNAMKYDFTECNYAAYSADGVTKGLCSKSIFDSTVELEFEGEFFKAPERYHEYLKNMYGDYMTPPPPEERSPKHRFNEAYWKDEYNETGGKNT